MPKRSATGKLVRRSVKDIPAPTAEDLSRLRAGMDGPIDTSDIPEAKGPFRRIERDATGRLPQRRDSPIRRAILAELERRQMTRYQLWKEARAFCGTLPQSAVYEYLRGRREIGLPYAEALLQALGLGVCPQKTSPPMKTGKTDGRKPRSAQEPMD
jgi:hypothetical protein